MSFIIFDTEYTSWAGCQTGGWRGKQKREIVQISAIRVSNDMRDLLSFGKEIRIFLQKCYTQKINLFFWYLH